MELSLSSRFPATIPVTSASPRLIFSYYNGNWMPTSRTGYPALITSDDSPDFTRKFSWVRLPSTAAHRRHRSVWACSKVDAAGTDPLFNKVFQFRDAFWRFLRPHTIRGTTIGSFSLVTRALIENPKLIRWSLLLKAFSGLLTLLCGNGFIVGINQIYDVGIDKRSFSIVCLVVSFSAWCCWSAACWVEFSSFYYFPLLPWPVPWHHLFYSPFPDEAISHCGISHYSHSSRFSPQLWCLLCHKGCSWSDL